MDKCQHLKAFVGNALDYLRSQSESKLNLLMRHLQVLSVTSDVSVFEPNNGTCIEFYTSLYELMVNLEPSCPLVWSAVTVLQQACKNTTARTVLTHRFKFVPVLTRMLANNLTREKKIKILKSMQDLTYGTKIPWQEAHLKKLMSILTSWIANEKNDIGTLSLGVLVNLCNKNTPAVYTLFRCVDNKAFLRTILKLKNDNIFTSVLALKLLNICDSISGGITDADVLYFISVTFHHIETILKTRDHFLMNLIIDFFADVISNNHLRDVLLTYKSFKEDVEGLVERSLIVNEEEETSMVLELLRTLLSAEIVDLAPLHGRFLELALRSVECPTTAAHALSTASAVLSHSNCNDGVIMQLRSSIPCLVDVLFISDMMTDVQHKLCELLRDMCAIPQLREKLLEVLNLEKVQQQLVPSVMPDNRSHYYYDERSTLLLVTTLELSARLAAHDERWQVVSRELLQPASVQMVLALALASAPQELRHRVLAIIASPVFTSSCMSELSKSLCNIQPCASPLPIANAAVPNISPSHFPSSQSDLLPPCSLERAERVDQLVSQLELAVSRKEVGGMVSSVMELYGQKVAMLSQSERTLQESLAAATSHCTQLQHQAMQLRAEVSSLHQLLYSSQQCCEGLEREKTLLAKKVEESIANAATMHSQYVQDFKEKQRLIQKMTADFEDVQERLLVKERELEINQGKLEECLKKISTLDREISDKLTEIKMLEIKNKDMSAKNTELNLIVSKLESRIEKRDRMIQELQEQKSSLIKRNETLQSECENLEEVCKAQEKSLQEKECEVEVLQRQLNELQRIRDMIYNISAGNLKPNN